MLNAPVSTVVRDGEVQKVPSKELVLDDIVIFKAGNQICADAVVVDGNASVNESLLTGESDEVSKKPGDTLMSGSYIVSGSCRARLEKVGRESYISRLTIQAKKTKKGEQSEMIRSLNRIVKFAGFAIIPIGIILFYQAYYVNNETIRASVQSMVAAVIGMIPEGLFLLASVALVISTMKLAVNKVLVHDMKCIETLARVDVLCVDKTGTITENTMSVSAVVNVDDGDDDDRINGLYLLMIKRKRYYLTGVYMAYKQFRYSVQLNMENQQCVVIGGGNVALRKAASLLKGIRMCSELPSSY